MVNERFNGDHEADELEAAIVAARGVSVDEELVRRVEQRAIALANDRENAALYPNKQSDKELVFASAKSIHFVSCPSGELACCIAAVTCAHSSAVASQNTMVSEVKK